MIPPDDRPLEPNEKNNSGEGRKVDTIDKHNETDAAK